MLIVGGCSLEEKREERSNDEIGILNCRRSYTDRSRSSAMGSFLIMGLFGLLLAIVVNVFLRSTGLDFVISAAGVGFYKRIQ